MELKINELTIQWRKIVFAANGLVKLDTYMFKKKKGSSCPGAVVNESD